MSRLVLLDNEAVQALSATTHPKHRRAIAAVQVSTTRRRRGDAVRIAVPTSVRVEAGWDRRAAASAGINRLRITDLPLDTRTADEAAAIRADTGVFVADAHLGVAIREAAAPGDRVAVLTSDPGDLARVADVAPVTIVTL